MIKIEDECCSCPKEIGCLGSSCPNRNVRVLICDRCGEEVEELFKVESGYDHLCEECLLDILKIGKIYCDECGIELVDTDEMFSDNANTDDKILCRSCALKQFEKVDVDNG